MENRFEHDPPEEKQNWGLYATPPALPGQQQNQQNEPSQRTTAVTLCARVQEMLPSLLENDGTIRPEMASAIRAHLSGCPGCTREYKELQRVILLLDKIPMADMPMDYAPLIMQRIQAQTSQPNTASASSVTAQAVVQTSATIAKTQRQTQSTLMQSTVQNVTSRLTLIQRVFLAGIFTAVLGFYLSSEWGQQMLGVNVETATQWLAETAEAVRHIPLLGWVAGSAFAALSQATETLQSASRTIGATAAHNMAFEVALCAGTCAVLVALNRQRTQQNNGREG